MNQMETLPILEELLMMDGLLRFKLKQAITRGAESGLQSEPIRSFVSSLHNTRLADDSANVVCRWPNLTLALIIYNQGIHYIKPVKVPSAESMLGHLLIMTWMNELCSRDTDIHTIIFQHGAPVPTIK